MRKTLWKQVQKLFSRGQPSGPRLIRYWQWRSLFYGSRAAYNLALPPSQLQHFTAKQADLLLKPLDNELQYPPKYILDFGCGPGRFSPVLAQRYQAKVLAIDPIKRFLKQAPPHPLVQYQLLKPNRLNLPHCTFDLIWIVHVLSGIPTDELPSLANQLQQSLKPNGLLLLCESTSPHPPQKNDYWFLHPAEFYLRLFPRLHIRSVAQWQEFDQKVNLFIGKKTAIS